MICPHKYTGCNPSVVYPKLRTAYQAWVWYNLHSPSGEDHAKQCYDEARAAGRVHADVIADSWPRVDVEELLACATVLTAKLQ
jgi:hypothetical protein